MAGQKTPARLANLPDVNVSERTLRNSRWSNKTVERIEEGVKSNIRDKLTNLEWPEKEIDEFVLNHPKSPYAGLIYECQIPDKMEFPRTIEFAARIDEISLSLTNAREQDSLEEFKRILLASELLDRRYYVEADDEWSSSAEPEALNLIKAAQDWCDIEKPLGVLIFNTLFSVMSYWDIEFYHQFFSNYDPKPLFSQVLPKLDPDAKYLDKSTIAKRRGMFWIPVKRLIDLMACLGNYRLNNCWPDQVPKVLDIVRMTDYCERELVNWRDGTKRLLIRNFRGIWKDLWPDTIAPTPLFIAAIMWQTYFIDVGVNKKPKTMFLFEDRYQWWWEAHLSALASDFSLSSEGKERWPACFDAI